jgi:hypothetical protein
MVAEPINDVWGVVKRNDGEMRVAFTKKSDHPFTRPT